ncbi:MAG: CerR family C-terminal domain-containing protein [Phycisphaerae bacterium]|jgi:AcrR family transcriptional regulator
MRKQRSDGQETRRNLLAAAGEVFARKGFREATIVEICQQAAANTAAISYHFGSKEALYVESWRYAFTQSLKTYPLDGGIPSEAPAEEKLRGRILAIMRRIIDPQSHEFDIFHKEMASPTGLLTRAIQESVEPIFQGLALLVRELLGKEPREHDVQLCTMSIRAQCFGSLLHARHCKIAQGLPSTDFGFESLFDDVEQLADHVTRFSMAGIRALGDRQAQQSDNEVGL